jgi:hypothetical protein
MICTFVLLLPRIIITRTFPSHSNRNYSKAALLCRPVIGYRHQKRFQNEHNNDISSDPV